MRNAERGLRNAEYPADTVRCGLWEVEAPRDHGDQCVRRTFHVRVLTRVTARRATLPLSAGRGARNQVRVGRRLLDRMRSRAVCPVAASNTSKMPAPCCRGKPESPESRCLHSTAWHD